MSQPPRATPGEVLLGFGDFVSFGGPQGPDLFERTDWGTTKGGRPGRQAAGDDSADMFAGFKEALRALGPGMGAQVYLYAESESDGESDGDGDGDDGDQSSGAPDLVGGESRRGAAPRSVTFGPRPDNVDGEMPQASGFLLDDRRPIVSGVGGDSGAQQSGCGCDDPWGWEDQQPGAAEADQSLKIF